MAACRNPAFSSSYLLLLAGILLLAVFSTEVSAGVLSGDSWIPSRASCDGSIGECFPGNEFVMDSESTRRILATNQYISYASLSRGNTPCSRAGASYYNCRPGASSNPYNRGCSQITRCARS